MKYILTYGIACVDESCGKQELISQVSDVTTDGELAKHLVDLLNENQLSPEHLNDVVEDLLCEI